MTRMEHPLTWMLGASEHQVAAAETPAALIAGMAPPEVTVYGFTSSKEAGSPHPVQFWHMFIVQPDRVRAFTWRSGHAFAYGCGPSPFWEQMSTWERMTSTYEALNGGETANGETVFDFAHRALTRNSAQTPATLECARWANRWGVLHLFTPRERDGLRAWHALGYQEGRMTTDLMIPEYDECDQAFGMVNYSTPSPTRLPGWWTGPDAPTPFQRRGPRTRNGTPVPGGMR